MPYFYYKQSGKGKFVLSVDEDKVALYFIPRGEKKADMAIRDALRQLGVPVKRVGRKSFSLTLKRTKLLKHHPWIFLNEWKAKITQALTDSSCQDSEPLEKKPRHNGHSTSETTKAKVLVPFS